MSLTLPLTSSLKKQSPSLGTDPLSVPYSIILCIQQMYSTYLGYIWSGLRLSDVLSLFKDGKLKQAQLHMTTWLSNTYLIWATSSCPFLSVVALHAATHSPLPTLGSRVNQGGKQWFFVYVHFVNWTVLFCQKIQLSLTSKTNIFSDFSLLVTCRWNNLIFYFPERLLLCIANSEREFLGSCLKWSLKCSHKSEEALKIWFLSVFMRLKSEHISYRIISLPWFMWKLQAQLSSGNTFLYSLCHLNAVSYCPVCQDQNIMGPTVYE